MSAPDNAVQAAREAPRPERDEVVEQTRRFADELFKFATPTQALWFAMPTALNATNRDRLFASGLQTLITRLALAERDRDAAIKSASDGWRAAGEAQGKLEAEFRRWARNEREDAKREKSGDDRLWRRRIASAWDRAADRAAALTAAAEGTGGAA